MPLTVKCYATLAKYQPLEAEQYEFSRTRGTVAELLQELDIPLNEVKIIFVNNKSASLDTQLQDGDKLGLFPAVGGG